MRLLLSTIAVLALGSTLSGGASAASLNVVTQGECSPAPCASFGPSGAIPDVRLISTVAPISGSAVAYFQGGMSCQADAKVENFARFQSQIVRQNDTTPDGAGAGGLELYATLSSASDHASVVGGQAFYNLSSIRTFSVTQGQNLNLAFRLARAGNGVNVNCVVGASAAFTIIFVP